MPKILWTIVLPQYKRYSLLNFLSLNPHYTFFVFSHLNDCTIQKLQPLSEVFQPLTATESHYSHVHSFVPPLGPNLYRTVYFPSHFLHISRCIVHFAFFLKKTFVVFRQIRHAVYIPHEKGRKKGIAPVPCSTGAIEGVSLLVWGGIMYRVGIAASLLCASHYKSQLRALFEWSVNIL